MKAAIDRYGVPEVLRYDNVDKPAINPDQLLVKVYASSVSPIDWKIRQGMLKFLTGSKFPLILGFDVAGEVVEVGNRVTCFKVGDAIYARLNQIAEPMQSTLRFPKSCGSQTNQDDVCRSSGGAFGSDDCTSGTSR